jgi:AcrR family transcriptional regulator
VTADARAPGRPRSEEADRAILDAAIEVFAEAGLDGVTVEGVAARAGVGKATIYRRYPGKVELVIAAASALCEAEAPDADTGTVDEDLRVIGRNLVRLLSRTPAGRAMPQLVADAALNDELRVAHRQFVARRRERTVAAVRRGIVRGELRDDTDVDLVVDLIGGPIFYRHLVSGGRIDAAFADRLVASALAPWRA